MPQICTNQRTPEWHAARKGKITSSIAAACVGLNPWMSRQKAWRVITGREPEFEGNQHTRWGTEFEGAARSWYENETGDLVTETGFWIAEPPFEWLGSSPDGFIGADGAAEFKCPKELPTTVPTYHEIQILVNLFCTARKWCDYVAWRMDKQFVKRVERFAEYKKPFDELLVELEKFYKDHVIADAEPPRKRRNAGGWQEP